MRRTFGLLARRAAHPSRGGYGLAALCLAALLVTCANRAHAQAKPFLQSTPACKLNMFVCHAYSGPINNEVKTLSKISIAVPGPGSVMVTVSGSGSCYTAEGPKGDYLALFSAQIVDRPHANPVASGLGGLSVAARLQASAATASMADSRTFNLGVSRIFQVTAGQNTFYFRAKILIYENMDCNIVSLSMQSLYLPD